MRIKGAQPPNATPPQQIAGLNGLLTTMIPYYRALETVLKLFGLLKLGDCALEVPKVGLKDWAGGG